MGNYHSKTTEFLSVGNYNSKTTDFFKMWAIISQKLMTVSNNFTAEILTHRLKNKSLLYLK